MKRQEGTNRSCSINLTCATFRIYGINFLDVTCDNCHTSSRILVKGMIINKVMKKIMTNFPIDSRLVNTSLW